MLALPAASGGLAVIAIRSPSVQSHCAICLRIASFAE